MARYIYARVSTLHQDYPQQRNTIDRYLNSIGVGQDSIDSELVEKMTGTTEHTTRKFAHLFSKCKHGDIIYFSELSRIGRSMSDLNNIVHQACERGIILMQCKDGMRIEDVTIGGKALLFALSLAAELEVENLHQRTQSGVDVAIAEIKANGKRITKAGTIQTHWGNKKGTVETKAIMAIAQEASARARTNRAIEWLGQSSAVKFARLKRAEGWPIHNIVNELGILYDMEQSKIDKLPDNKKYVNPYGTPNNCKPSKGTVSKWLRSANPLLMAN